MLEKVKAQDGVKIIELKSEKQEPVKCEKRKTKDREKENLIIKILKAFEKEKEDPIEEYLKKVDGRYERYIRKYFEDVLIPAEKKLKYGKKETVIFYHEGKIILIKSITVYRENKKRTLRIKDFIFNVKSPKTVTDKIKYEEKEMKKEDLYRAIIKTNAIMCDVKQMA